MPVLYSFRRCPYAIRARMALLYAGIDVELREVLLKDKPRHMLELSAKGTVPVLQLAGQVLDESWDILCWATAQRDSDAWRGVDDCHLPASKALVREVDESFKPWLDKYKYIVPETAHLQASYRAACGRFLAGLESRLNHSAFLLDDNWSLADIGAFPFVRQFAGVDTAWFSQSPYRRLNEWLTVFVESGLFRAAMSKNKPWSEGDPPRYLVAAQCSGGISADL